MEPVTNRLLTVTTNATDNEATVAGAMAVKHLLLRFLTEGRLRFIYSFPSVLRMFLRQTAVDA